MQVMISKTLKILLTFCCNKSNPPTYSCLTDRELNVPDVSMKGRVVFDSKTLERLSAKMIKKEICFCPITVLFPRVSQCDQIG